MTLVSQGRTGYLTHLQDQHRYSAVKNLAKPKTFKQPVIGWYFDF